MRYSRVLLVGLQYPTGYNRLPNQPPAGLGYIAEQLESRVEYDVMDMSLGYSSDDLLRRIRQFRPDIVGVSMMTFGYRRAYDLFARIRREHPALPIAVGGAHISTFRAKALADCPAIDYGFVMEGEISFRELCVGAELDTIQGILYRRADRIEETPAGVIEHLDDLQFPRYERFELSRYVVKRMNIVTSRGCPYRCTYCPVESAIGRRFRPRSPASIVAEIGYWYGRGYRDFGIADDNFTLVPERVDALCALLEERRMDITLECSNGLRADSVDGRLLGRMREVGFRTVAFGVEAGNNRMLRVLKKQESIETIEHAISIACDLGFTVILFFIVGSPTETWDDVQESIALARKYPVADARFYNIIPFPNTELFEWVKTHHCFLRDPEEYLNDASLFENSPCFETPELSGTRRRELLALTADVTREIRRNALTRRLKRFGPAGSLAASVFLSRWFRSLYLGNRHVRAAGERLKSFLGEGGASGYR
jgi:anaerobic magnesium-protoporphyrin IX monomethyl ester cyclase